MIWGSIGDEMIGDGMIGDEEERERITNEGIGDGSIGDGMICRCNDLTVTVYVVLTCFINLPIAM